MNTHDDRQDLDVLYQRGWNNPATMCPVVEGLASSSACKCFQARPDKAALNLSHFQGSDGLEKASQTTSSSTPGSRRSGSPRSTLHACSSHAAVAKGGSTVLPRTSNLQPHTAGALTPGGGKISRLRSLPAHPTGAKGLVQRLGGFLQPREVAYFFHLFNTFTRQEDMSAKYI